VDRKAAGYYPEGKNHVLYPTNVAGATPHGETIEVVFARVEPDVEGTRSLLVT